MNRVNYQKELDKILEALEKEYAGSAAVKSEADEQHGAKAQRSPAERRGPDERWRAVPGPDFAPVRKKLLLHSCCAPCSRPTPSGSTGKWGSPSCNPLARRLRRRAFCAAVATSQDSRL